MRASVYRLLPSNGCLFWLSCRIMLSSFTHMHMVTSVLLWVIEKLSGNISGSDLSKMWNLVCQWNEMQNTFVSPTIFLAAQALYLLIGLTSSIYDDFCFPEFCLWHRFYCPVKSLNYVITSRPIEFDDLSSSNLSGSFYWCLYYHKMDCLFRYW